ncbi:thiamine biosynthesis protein ThiJ [Streptomyces sp. AS58]|uniref:Type 1 glutamine amidotransferase domain-containing protein n=1 Tax=Streptomyces cadmiisoli TaxID=2184053 RepID=A0A2Z4IU03_9ACTN|nr:MULTISPECIES: type 1 glutamine amidotransferase domain-containing protein [Streptomyces]AWW36169.1 type 1 glutamine amidotransferase domain-containing protein [Streptomyces cadmiisoli]KOV72047.1 thiamine biosynthesis protein ThiJ [Streptomyces sp. AS58]
MAKILMVVSGADSMRLADGTTHPTGYWAEEVAVSHEVLTGAGAQVVIATPGGVRPTVDALSLDERGGVAEADARRHRAYLDGIADQLSAPLALAEARADDYDAVLVPGGHAPMADLATDAALGRLLGEADASGRTVAALCHGVAALLSADRQDAGFTFAGRTLTSFTDEEERQGGLGDNTPYYLESRLRERGAVIRSGPAWSSTVVQDGNLITGQNPQSSRATAEAVLKNLKDLTG